MKYSQKALGAVLAAAVLAILLISPAASAQDHVIAIGKVSSAGAIVNSANTLGAGATVVAAPNGTGDYTITVTAAGAFTGNVTDDFIGEVTCEDDATDDQVPKMSISSVNANQLVVLVHIDDVEDDTATNLAEARNDPFFFAIYRVPSSFPEKGSTKYLFAAGKVSLVGTLLSGTGVDGVAVASSRPGAGDFRVLLSKTGAFAGASADDFVILLSLNGTGTSDRAIRGEVSAIGDDVVTITVRTDDIQDEANDDVPVPASNTFHFTVYRIPAGAGTGLAQSRLLVGLGKVASNGSLVNGGAFDGGALASVRDSAGRYTVTITSAGAFAGKTDNQYVLQVHLNQGFSADEVIEGDIGGPSDDVLTLSVTTNDGEQAGGDVGVAIDAPFFFLIYDVEPDFRPDLRIGTKKNLTQQIGDDIYNAGAAGQKINVKLPGNQKKKYFFSLENDGNLTDDVFLKAKRSGNKIRTKYFRITGGRTNVTAAIKVGLVEDDVAPCKIIKYEVQAKYLKPNRPTKTLRYLARSQFAATQLDANKATLKPK